MINVNFNNWQRQSLNNKKKYANGLQKANKNAVLKRLPQLHREAFEKVDCLQCAQCCKNYSPRFKMPDIKRISKFLGMKESDFIIQYLNMDDEGDYVVKSSPCPFLNEDNTCNIYDVRPSDCARFPYTNEDVLFKRKNITLKNSEFCPIVYYVLENLFAD
ncbi:MAG: YkgJ family cysteine cluster protein [Arachidicoccus sp.]|nr:YkgJ family cysteine cluster protein [Arachidicoccus sp.]